MSKSQYYPPKRKVEQAVLAIDPGITTGWALLDRNGGDILGTSVWGTHELERSLDILVRTCFTAGIELTCVIEEMPPGAFGDLARKLERVRGQIKRIIEETYEIRTVRLMPGEWKPSRIAKTTQVPWKFNDSPLMVHQKDAVKMGRYAIDKEARAA